MSTFDIMAMVGAAAWLYPAGVWIRKLILKPKIRITPADTVEIGYTNFGPILNLQCAISTERKEALIERIEARITHEKGDSRLFTWKFLDENQSTLTSFSGDSGATIRKSEVAIAMLVRTTALNQKNIGFQDNVFHKGMLDVGQKYLEKDRHIRKTESDKTKESLIESQEYSNLVSFFKNSFSWKAGSYKIQLISHVVSLKSQPEEKFEFELMQHEIDLLKQNITHFEDLFKSTLSPDLEDEAKKAPPEKWKWVVTKIERDD